MVVTRKKNLFCVFFFSWQFWIKSDSNKVGKKLLHSAFHVGLEGSFGLVKGHFRQLCFVIFQHPQLFRFRDSTFPLLLKFSHFQFLFKERKSNFFFCLQYITCCSFLPFSRKRKRKMGIFWGAKNFFSFSVQRSINSVVWRENNGKEKKIPSNIIRLFFWVLLVPIFASFWHGKQQPTWSFLVEKCESCFFVPRPFFEQWLYDIEIETRKRH